MRGFTNKTQAQYIVGNSSNWTMRNTEEKTYCTGNSPLTKPLEATKSWANATLYSKSADQHFLGWVQTRRWGVNSEYTVS